MKLDWTINVWQIVTAIVFIFGAYGAALRIYHLLDKRLTALEVSFLDHTRTLTEHATRLTRYEESLFRIVGDLQRVVGRVEASGLEHRHARETDRS